MGPKREIPSHLRAILDWDVRITDNFVKKIDKMVGPLSKYRGNFKALEMSCHGITWFLGTAAIIFLTDNANIRQLAVNIYFALIMDIVVVSILKAFTRRRRPRQNCDDQLLTIGMDKFSFPSGHATRSVLVTSLLIFQYNLFFPLSLLLLGWSAATCISRVMMQRHHILDVIVGIVIAWSMAFIYSTFFWLSPEASQSVVGYFFDETQAGASFDV